MSVARCTLCILIFTCAAGCHIDVKHGYMRTGPEFFAGQLPQLSLEQVLTDSYRPELPPSQVVRAKLERRPRAMIAGQAADSVLHRLSDDPSAGVNQFGIYSHGGQPYATNLLEAQPCETCQSGVDRISVNRSPAPPASDNSNTGNADTTQTPPASSEDTDEAAQPQSTNPPALPSPAASQPTVTQPTSDEKTPAASPQPQSAGNQQPSRQDLEASLKAEENTDILVTEHSRTIVRPAASSRNWHDRLCEACRSPHREVQACVDDICDEVPLPPWVEAACEHCSEQVSELTGEIQEHAPDSLRGDWRHAAHQKLDQLRTHIGSVKEHIDGSDPFEIVRPSTQLRRVNWSEFMQRTRGRIPLPSFTEPRPKSQAGRRPARKSDRWRDGWNSH